MTKADLPSIELLDIQGESPSTRPDGLTYAEKRRRLANLLACAFGVGLLAGAAGGVLTAKAVWDEENVAPSSNPENACVFEWEGKTDMSVSEFLTALHATGDRDAVMGDLEIYMPETGRVEPELDTVIVDGSHINANDITLFACLANGGFTMLHMPAIAGDQHGVFVGEIDPNKG